MVASFSCTELGTAQLQLVVAIVIDLGYWYRYEFKVSSMGLQQGFHIGIKVSMEHY